MSWATEYIKQLKEGKTVQFRPRGNSMTGKISSGQLVTVVPFDGKVEVGDIVLCQVKGKQYLHLVTQVDVQIQISNNKGKINGWIMPRSIFGKCVSVTD